MDIDRKYPHNTAVEKTDHGNERSYSKEPNGIVDIIIGGIEVAASLAACYKLYCDLVANNNVNKNSINSDFNSNHSNNLNKKTNYNEHINSTISSNSHNSKNESNKQYHILQITSLIESNGDDMLHSFFSKYLCYPYGKEKIIFSKKKIEILKKDLKLLILLNKLNSKQIQLFELFLKAERDKEEGKKLLDKGMNLLNTLNSEELQFLQFNLMESDKNDQFLSTTLFLVPAGLLVIGGLVLAWKK